MPLNNLRSMGYLWICPIRYSCTKLNFIGLGSRSFHMDEISVVKNEVKYAGRIAMVEECQRSGLSIRVWCEANDINLKTYHYRLRRLRTMFLDQKKINTKQR